MNLTKEIEDTTKRISELYSTLKGTDAASKIATKINDIIIFGDKVSIPALFAAWDYFAYKRGVKLDL